jgi:EmrB/QacA subfamily drug resistance transporter
MRTTPRRSSLTAQPVRQGSGTSIAKTAPVDESARGSVTLGPPRKAGAALALILVAAFMVVLDFSIVNVALAAIERELHADATAVQWVITAYAITFGGLLVLGGRMGDLWGRRRMFVVGLLVFSFASLAGGLAGDLKLLVAARAVQGLGAAIVAPAALSLITTTTPAGPARTRALGYYGATASIGFVAGLVLGGVLVQFFDWRAVLWVNVPIGLVAALLTPVLVPAPTRVTRRHRLDIAGALLVTGGVAATVYAISQGPVSGWLSWPTVGGLVLAMALTGAFVVVEQHHPAPLVRLGILRLRSLRSANLYTLLIGAWSAGELLVVPLYLQLVLHYSPLMTGLAMAPQGIVGFLGATRGARVVQAVGLRVFLVISGLSAASGLLLLGLVLEWKSYPLLLAGMMLAGYGTATGAFGATVAATQDVADDEQGLAGGLVNMSRQVGAALGVTLAAAAIGAGAASGGSVGPDRSAVLLTFLAAALASVIAFYGLGTRIRAVSTRMTSGPLESAPVGVVAGQHIDYAGAKEHGVSRRAAEATAHSSPTTSRDATQPTKTQQGQSETSGMLHGSAPEHDRSFRQSRSNCSGAAGARKDAIT